MIMIDPKDETCVVELEDGRSIYVAIKHLLAFPPYQQLPQDRFRVNGWLVNKMKLRHNIDCITEDFIEANPVTVLCSNKDASIWHFGDGRHRLHAAYKLGLRDISCKFVPYEMWKCFIIHRVNSFQGQQRPELVKFKPQPTNAGFGL